MRKQTKSWDKSFVDALNEGATSEYYSIEEVSQMLKVAYLTVYRWIQSKKLIALKAGKQYRIKKDDLDKFLKQK